MRRSWTSVAGVCAVALLAVHFAWQGEAPVAQALDSQVPMAAPADEQPPTREPKLLLGPDVPASGAPTHRITTLAAA